MGYSTEEAHSACLEAPVLCWGKTKAMRGGHKTSSCVAHFHMKTPSVLEWRRDPAIHSTPCGYADLNHTHSLVSWQCNLPKDWMRCSHLGEAYLHRTSAQTEAQHTESRLLGISQPPEPTLGFVLMGMDHFCFPFSPSHSSRRGRRNLKAWERQTERAWRPIIQQVNFPSSNMNWFFFFFPRLIKKKLTFVWSLWKVGLGAQSMGLPAARAEWSHLEPVSRGTN